MGCLATLACLCLHFLQLESEACNPYNSWPRAYVAHKCTFEAIGEAKYSTPTSALGNFKATCNTWP